MDFLIRKEVWPSFRAFHLGVTLRVFGSVLVLVHKANGSMSRDPVNGITTGQSVVANGLFREPSCPHQTPKLAPHGVFRVA